MIQTRDLMFLAYNPYSNREFKKENNAVAYNPYIITTQANVNFNPNDGITTQVVVNAVPLADFDKVDYCCVVDGPYNVESHWFVMEAIRTKGGQYSVTLRRDVFVDFNTEIATATSFVERGMPQYADPAIINSEGYQFNKIKQSEHLLKDETNCPWIVGYLNLNSDAIADASDTETFDPAKKKTRADDLDLKGDWFINNNDHIIMKVETESGSGTYNKDMGLTRLRYSMKRDMQTLTAEQYNWLNNNTARVTSTNLSSITVKFDTEHYNTDSTMVTYKYDVALHNDNSQVVSMREVVHTQVGRTTRYDSFGGRLANMIPDEAISDIRTYINQWTINHTDQWGLTDGYYTYNGNVYKLSFGKLTADTKDESNLSALTNCLDVTAAAGNWYINNDIDYTPSFSFPYTFEEINFDPVNNPNIDILVYMRKSWERAYQQPYSIFCMPLSDELVTIYKAGQFYSYKTASSEINWATAMAFSKGMSGSKALVDLQLLPYCPLRDLINDGNIDLHKYDNIYGGDASGKLYEYIYKEEDDEEIVSGFMYFVTKADFKFSIEHYMPAPSNVLDFKVTNEVDQYILKSPNYNGQFEFKPTTNYGVSIFNVTCTYKPFNPYVRVCPQFSGLYGNYFTDNRGLVCQGDFSLPQLYDAWMTYQMNNKNYVNIFNTQLQTMQQQKNLAYERSVGNSMFAGIGAGMAGYEKGGLAGGALAAGSAVGAGFFNAEMSKQSAQLNIDQFRANYQYNLENIQANQGSLQSVDAKTITNKLFPFIEYYTCTDREREACKNNIIWNGCTISRIGLFSNYIDPEQRTLIKGYIINSPTLHADNHLFNTINEELQKGVYIV